jgi:hypothetical protein
MKTAEEILKENTGHAHGLMDAMVIKSLKEFALEVAKEALRNAADNATITGNWDSEISDVIHSVDKESILSHDNIPEL